MSGYKTHFPCRLRSRLFFYFIALVAPLFSIAFAGTTAVAQTCPANILHLPLAISARLAEADCTTSQGREICTLWCPYTNRGGELETADLKVSWTKAAQAGAPLLDLACGPSPEIPFGIIAPNTQAKATWTGSTFSLKQEVGRAAVKIFDEVRTTAAPCPRSIGVRGEGGGILPDLPPQCKSSRPTGKVTQPEGKVEIYNFAFDKWKGPITAEFPVFPCDRVRTGRDGSAMVELYLPSGLVDRVQLYPDTLFEIAMLTDFQMQRAVAPGEEPSYGLSEGMMRSFGARGITRQQQLEEHRAIFNVRTPTVVGVRGTDVIIRRDAAKKEDYVLLNQGEVSVTSGNQSVVLRPGQQVFTSEGKLSEPSLIKAGVWDAIIARRVLPDRSLFSDAVAVAATDGKGMSSKGEKELPNEKASGSGSQRPPGWPPGELFNVAFRGRIYLTLYEAAKHEGEPIDVYFFEIKAPDGSQAVQDGEKLWGRFVRHPATGSDSKLPVTFYFVEWMFRGGRWEASQTVVEAFTVMK